MKPDTITSPPSELANQISQILFDSGSVRIDLNSIVTWASGICSPIYCDNRLLLSLPGAREKVIAGFESIIKESFSNINVICGVASAGVPWASMLAQRLSLPLVYVRKEAKGHGKGKQVEGTLEKGSNVIVIEDLISTGGSSAAAIEVLKDAGAEVVGLLAIVTYGLPDATERFKKLDIALKTLTNFEALVEVGLARGLFKDSDVEVLKGFQADPWGWR